MDFAIPNRNYQSTLDFVIKSLVSFTFYDLYWTYNNWKIINALTTRNLRAILRTVGLIVPILNIFLLYDQFKEIRNIASATSCATYSHPGWIALLYIILPQLAQFLPGLLAIIAVGSFIFLIPVHNTIYKYMKNNHPAIKPHRSFNTVEKLLMILGSFIWVLIIWSVFTNNILH